MAAKYWIKLYHEILQDPKMGRLPDNLWRRCIELFLLAGELGAEIDEDEKGHLPSTEELAWYLRQSPERLEAELVELAQVGILTKTESGWLVTNFAKRQKHIDTAERMKQYRERKKKKELQESDAIDKDMVTRNVTKRNIETDKESELDSTLKRVGETSPGSGPKTRVKDRFLELSHLQMPNLKKDTSFWWAQFGEILKLARDDPALACNWQTEAISYMQANHLTITGPQSILGMIRALASGQSLEQKNGVLNGHRQSNKNQQKGRSLNPRAMDTTAIEREIAELEQQLGGK
jgi:hypothetical protein